MSEPKKFELTSANITEERKAKLRALFPEIVTEGGKVDFDRLKLTLGESVDTGKERYGMNWPGKADCFKTIQKPSVATLVPAREESVNFDTTENLIIEGDNLEALKLLQKAYLGKVKMIYIDPPYNTGNDFIYPDNYTESLDTYLRYTGQVDDEGRKFSTNTEADGRFHSKWLNMMYPRLYLARNLLSDDGILFVSIDDNEVQNLRHLLNETFGEENFVDSIIWKKRYGGGAKEKYLVTIHEYILMYAKNKSCLGELFVPLSEESISRYYKYKDDNFERRGPYRTHPLESMKSFGERKNLVFSITAPDGKQVMPKRQWRWSPQRVNQAIESGELHFAKDRNGEWTVHTKQYLKDEDGIRETKFFSVVDDVFTQDGTNEILELFGDAQVFGFPKPSGLIAKLVQLATDGNNKDIVLDFFSGSGATAQSTLELNNQDHGNRRFILVQLPEPTGRTDYPTISEITKERARRVIKKLNKEEQTHLPNEGEQNQDRGFKFFKLQTSNFKAWNSEMPKDDEQLVKQLQLHVDHLVAGRGQEDVLYELLLKSGFPLTTKVESITLAGKTVFSVADSAMFICLEKQLTPEVIKAMADKKPERVVCLDEGFAGNDQLKTNAVQTMKAKGVTKFQTV